jgi:hypothetical protein
VASIEGQILSAISAAISQNQSAITAAAREANVVVSNEIEALASAIVAKNPILNIVLGGVISGLGPQIVAALGGEEQALITLVQSWLAKEIAAAG